MKKLMSISNIILHYALVLAAGISVCYAYDNKNYDYADYYWGKDIHQKN